MPVFHASRPLAAGGLRSRLHPFPSLAAVVGGLTGARPPCTECGAAQRLTGATTDYPESGLDNVRLVDVPVWECGSEHQEVEIPKAEQLHGLFVNALIRKPAALVAPEIRFLRKELAMSGRALARHFGMTAEHLSRLETGRRTVSQTTSLLVRLAVAWELTRRRRSDFRPSCDRSSAIRKRRPMPALTVCNTAVTCHGSSRGCRCPRSLTKPTRPRSASSAAVD